MVKKTKEEAELTYHALLDAAVNCFIRQGVAKTTLNQIAKEAKMTRGAIYWHFKNKDDVIQALWERNASQTTLAFTQLSETIEGDQASEQFRTLVKNLLQMVVEQPETAQVIRIIMHSVEFTDEQTPLQAFLLSKKQIMFNGMLAAFEKLKYHNQIKISLSTTLLTMSLMSYLHGLIHDYLSPITDDLNLKKDGDQLLDIFLDGLLL